MAAYSQRVEAPWQDPVWLAGVKAWIDARLEERGLARSGDAEQPHIRPWATAIRVPTAQGDVWFKAAVGALAHEAAVVTLLSGRNPELVPPLLAADPAQGWMLMADAGTPLRSVTEEEPWLAGWWDVLPRYARLQIDVASDVDELLALGVPDLRLAGLPGRFEQLLDSLAAPDALRDQLPRVRELCEDLAAYGVAETLQHDDLHDAQIFVRDGRYRLLDWGDACVSHPFFTLAVSLEGVVAWGLDDVEGAVDTGPLRDAYLRPFEERYDVDLAPAVAPALRLGWVCRAVNGHVVGEESQTLTRLRMFLDG